MSYTSIVENIAFKENLSSRLIWLRVLLGFWEIIFFWSLIFMKSLEKRKKDFYFSQQKQ